MVIDTSAVIAILQGEPERRSYVEAIEAADFRRISVASFVEISIVLDATYGSKGLWEFDRFTNRAGIELVPVSAEQGHVARGAYNRFGKGRHRAALNFGDCFSYALAMVLGEPLLFKGNDFVHTDVAVAGV